MAAAVVTILLAGNVPPAQSAAVPAARIYAAQVYDACSRLTAGQVQFNTYGASRVTFATAPDRNRTQVAITSCVKTGSGYSTEWQTTGFAGINGFSAPGKAWEDTYRSPTGSFTVTEALGRRNPGTALRYRTIKPSSRWGGERGSTYNQYFEGAGGPADENLWTFMNQGYYEQAAVINYNRLPDASTIQGASYAIFFHAGNVPSAGCISTALSTVTRFLRTSRPGDRIVMGAVSDVFRSAARTGPSDTAGKSLASIHSSSDVLAVAPDGTLWNYPALGNGRLGQRAAIGKGWGTARSLSKVDWNRDGTLDLLAQWPSGTLTVYPGQPAGGFGAPFTAAAGGWLQLTITAGTWDTARRYPGVLARDAAGKLWLYDNPEGRGLGTRRLVGSGWGNLSNLTIADWDNNGRPDLLASGRDGILRLYRQDGRGNFLREARPQIGTGWSARSITANYSFQGAGTRGLTVLFQDGALRYYPLGQGRWGAPSTIGTGWGGMRTLVR
jgi:L,D-peptidoglycan transpeptidase YkuD (ErfK/YbiS/YcfS/YnhG family)